MNLGCYGSFGLWFFWFNTPIHQLTPFLQLDHTTGLLVVRLARLLLAVHSVTLRGLVHTAWLTTCCLRWTTGF